MKYVTLLMVYDMKTGHADVEKAYTDHNAAYEAVLKNNEKYSGTSLHYYLEVVEVV